MELTNTINYGDIYKIGNHYLLCGDSTDKNFINKYFNKIGDLKSSLLFADPPYGMNKEIKNDNIKGDKLLDFNKSFLSAFTDNLNKNSSLYICGQPEVLWKFYFNSDLSNKSIWKLKNEITWDKGDAGAGGVSFIGKDGMKSYPISTETILFLHKGDFRETKESFNIGYENILYYLKNEYKKSNLKQSDYNKLTNSCMYGHYFSKSQFSLISKKHYELLQNLTGNFNKDYEELKYEYKNVEKEETNYFNNTHDKMTNVWKYGRVKGKDRYNHPTPKPFKLIERIIKSSSRENDIITTPFAGSGVDYCVCEELKRICVGVEYDPKWCEVIINRLKETYNLSAELIFNIND